MMENTEGTVKELWGAAEETKALATSLIREAVEKMQAEFKERDEEMDHKFSLQVAENKRLQGHMAEIRKENKHLYAQVVELQQSRSSTWSARATWLVDVPRGVLASTHGSPTRPARPHAPVKGRGCPRGLANAGS